MSTFQREDRYLVIKYTDAMAALTQTEQDLMVELTLKIDGHRRRRGKDVLQAVVVEHDWPEYEPVWGMIERRVNPPKPKCACCGTTENLHFDSGSGGPWRCASPDCMVF